VCPRSSANLVVPSKTFDTRSRLAIFEPTHKEFSRRSKLSGSRDYFDAISKYPTTPPSKYPTTPPQESQIPTVH
jgi:hypothetical protein